MTQRLGMVCVAAWLIVGWNATSRADWELSLMEIGDENVVLDISMADERSACLVGARKSANGSAPRIQCTADGGKSWRSVSLSTSAQFWFPTAVYLQSADRGFVAAWELQSFKMIGTLFRGGASASSWEKLSLPGPPEGELEDVFFGDADHGWVVGAPGIYRTTSGGDTFDECPLPAWEGDGHPLGVFFLDAQHGWVVGGKPAKPGDNFNDPIPACCGFILQTSDGGQVWQVVRQGLEQALNRVWFADSLHGWVVGGGETALVLHTADGGESWTAQDLPADDDPPDQIHDVAFPDASTGYALGSRAGENTRLFVTADGGTTWTQDTSYMEAFDHLEGMDALAKYSALLTLSVPEVGRGMIGGKNAVVLSMFAAGYCPDMDGDGHADEACGGDDCDDNNKYIHPGAEEACNHLDENCDDLPDESFDFTRDPDNCGDCGFNCMPSQVCWDSKCVSECPAPLALCDRNCVDTDSDTLHCGGCDRPCLFEHATADCLDGQCVMGVCDDGWLDRDGDPANGCEIACSGSGAEVCDGIDNDCDGITDENLADCHPDTDGGTSDGQAADGDAGGDVQSDGGSVGESGTEEKPQDGSGCGTSGLQAGGLFEANGCLWCLIIGIWLTSSRRRRVSR